MLLEKYQTLQDWLGLLFLIKNKFRNKIPVASDFAKKTDYHAKILRENMLLILIAINLRVT